jgi:nucleotide-binding universal stress UspA family protein
MKTFQIKKLLLPTDFSETGLLAIEHGAAMAKRCQSELHLLHVLEQALYAFQAPEPILRLSSDEEIRKAADQKMKEIASRLQKDFEIIVVTSSRSGKIAKEVIDYAEEKEIDLILMGTHGANGYEEFFMGSNAEKVVNRANCPVITIQTHAHQVGFRDIVVPIDSTLHSRQKVDYAIEIAKAYGSTIHLLGLIESEEDDEAKFRAKMKVVEEVVKKAKIPYVEKTIQDANVAVTAMAYSEEVGADLIIVMADHESMIPGLFMGRFAKQIVNHSLIPVMSIKPHVGTMTSTNPAGSPSYAG